MKCCIWLIICNQVLHILLGSNLCFFGLLCAETGSDRDWQTFEETAHEQGRYRSIRVDRAVSGSRSMETAKAHLG